MFSEDNIEDMKKLLEDNCTQYDSPCSDMLEEMKFHNGDVV